MLTIMFTLTVVQLCLMFILAQTTSCKENVSPLGKYLYEDLKCSTSDGKSYKCDVASNKHCIFEGKKYEAGQVIGGGGLDAYCRSHCTCDESGSFECAVQDCFESPKPGCWLKEVLNQCCSVETCKPPKMNCTVNGTIYEDGSSFSPENQCISCVCEEGFAGKLEAPFCIKRRCLEQVFNMPNLANKCAAVYFKEDRCCPATWVCNEKQKIVKMNQDNSKSELTCDFGTIKVPHGHGFETTVSPYTAFVKVSCECTLPPFVTCLEITAQKN